MSVGTYSASEVFGLAFTISAYWRDAMSVCTRRKSSRDDSRLFVILGTGVFLCERAYRIETGHTLLLIVRKLSEEEEVIHLPSPSAYPKRRTCLSVVPSILLLELVLNLSESVCDVVDLPYDGTDDIGGYECE